MALETASYVANLVVTNPDGGDQRSTADDHLRLIKAVLVRTFPKIDSAVSLSGAQVMYLNDLSASVQLQLNQLRDGSATANNAVNSRFANSASTASNIGAIPAARVPDLNATNVFTLTGGGFSAAVVVSAVAPAFAWNQTGAAADNKVWDATVTSEAFQMRAVLDSNLNAGVWLSVQRTGITIDAISLAATSIVLTGTVTGTISNATEASHAASASFATVAASASTAAFATSAGSAAALSGLPPSDTGVANTIAQRNSAGDVFARYFNQASGIGESGVIDSIITTLGDNYFRRVTLAQLGGQLSAQNITGRTGITKTLSSSTPSGGSNGDIWYQIA